MRIKLSEKEEMELVKWIDLLHKKIEEGKWDLETFTQLADIRDYFMFQTLNALTEADTEAVKELVLKFENYEKISATHNLFFFTLAQLLSLKHKITIMPEEKISYEDWEKSFERTLKELGIRK